LTNRHIAEWRLHNVRLDGAPFQSPEDVVGWLVAVQSQDYGPAKWSLGQRTSQSSDAAIDRLIAEGHILRTHVLRPTWHFVLPADIRWLLELTAPRVHAFNAYYYRQWALDQAVLQTCADQLVGLLRGGIQLTRKELEVALARAGIAEPTGVRMGLILMHAELNGVLCSGAPRGKQRTYALLDERVPASVARQLDHEEALAELTRRYFTSHGPATVKDFRWWSSLTSAEIKTGLAMVGGQLEREVIDGATYWFGVSAPAEKARSPIVHLVQGYDEYVVGYGESKFALDAAGTARSVSHANVVFNMLVLLDSQLAGHWKRTLSKDTVTIEVALYAEFDAAQTQALHAAAARHAQFLGMTPNLVVRQIGAAVTGGTSWWDPRGRTRQGDPPLA
jgi:hypothetical protein